MKSPFAQPEKSRVANVIIAKSRVLAAQVLRILSRKGFGTFFKASERQGKARLYPFGVKFAHTPECGEQEAWIRR